MLWSNYRPVFIPMHIKNASVQLLEAEMYTAPGRGMTNAS